VSCTPTFSTLHRLQLLLGLHLLLLLLLLGHTRV
jgi:hypothetical protein